jgi:hypothetical protein
MIATRVLNDAAGAYLACLPAGASQTGGASQKGGGLLDSEAAALDLVAACGEAGSHRVLIGAANLPAIFYDLKTGLAGAVLQRFVIYQVRAAFVVPSERLNAGRFGEMVLESNRGRQFHFAVDETAASAWLGQAA